MKLLLFLTLLVFQLLSISETTGRIYTNCALKQLLEENKMPGRVNDWVCLVEEQTGGDTAAIQSSPYGSKAYGLFLISSVHWCQGPGTLNNNCHTNCTKFLDDDLSDDIACAKKIYGAEGFSSSFGWERYCDRKDNSKYTANCTTHSSTYSNDLPYILK